MIEIVIVRCIKDVELGEHKFYKGKEYKGSIKQGWKTLFNDQEVVFERRKIQGVEQGSFENYFEVIDYKYVLDREAVDSFFDGKEFDEFEAKEKYVLAKADKEGIALSQEAKLFLYGVRPVVITSKNSKKREELDFLQQYYPSMGFPFRSNVHLIFKDGETFHKFIEDKGLRLKQLEVNGGYFKESCLDYDHMVLGLYLGYDPKACKDYEGFIHVPKKDRAIINYHGIRYTCKLEDVETNILWLKETTKIPDEIKTEAYYTIFDEDGNKKKIEF